MKKLLMSVMLSLILMPILANATPSREGSSSTAEPVSMYGKTGAGAITGVLVDAAGNPQVDVVSSVPATVTVERAEESQALGSAALALTTTFSDKAKLRQVLIHAGSAITQTVTITFNSKTGATFDTVLSSESLVAETDFSYIPAPDFILEDGDEIDVAVTNSGTPAITVTATVIVEILQ